MTYNIALDELRKANPQAVVNLTLIPQHMRDGMALWITRGCVPGEFLTAILCNDLMTACGKADDINRHRIFQFAAYLYNYAPLGSYGSPEAVKDWAARGGLSGLEEARDG